MCFLFLLLDFCRSQNFLCVGQMIRFQHLQVLCLLQLVSGKPWGLCGLAACFDEFSTACLSEHLLSGNCRASRLIDLFGLGKSALPSVVGSLPSDLLQEKSEQGSQPALVSYHSSLGWFVLPQFLVLPSSASPDCKEFCCCYFL